MYLRFIAPGRPLRAGIWPGLFRPAYELAEDRDTPEGLAVAIRHELDWFEDVVPAPPSTAFGVRSRKRWLAHGICWFRADARDAVSHGHTLAALLGECGLPMARVTTRRPGQILYRDDWQVVAKPEAATPTRWC
jgi:hypothetical protein